MRIDAPFTDEQVEKLNSYQREGRYHPYTCPKGSGADHLDGEGILVATRGGWVCSYCDYRQHWAHEL